MRTYKVLEHCTKPHVLSDRHAVQQDQLVFSASMLTILMSSNGLSLRSVLAFSMVTTTSFPFVTCNQHSPLLAYKSLPYRLFKCNNQSDSPSDLVTAKLLQGIEQFHGGHFPSVRDWDLNSCSKQALIAFLPGLNMAVWVHTLPKTVCLLSSQGVGTVVIKNWLPLVLGPALAILRVKGRSCLRLRSNSS